MDERIFKIKTGHAIPEWDVKHRLPITGCVGPECKDSATIHRINSVFMDVSEQPHMMRQWFAGGIFTAAFGSLAFFVFFVFVLYASWKKQWDLSLGFLVFELVAAAIGFGYVCIKFGRDEVFSLTRRPIRFHRGARKIFAIRRRRFSSFRELGDLTVEVPWNEDAVFFVCIAGSKTPTMRIAITSGTTNWISMAMS